MRALADAGPVVLEQHDIFFGAGSGRLKVRFLGDGPGELIAYERADEPGPKACRYDLVATPDPRGLADLLSRALPARGEVHKTRRLYLAGRTRIHLDRVEGLGDFVELEVVLSPGEDPAAGRFEAERLMETLGVRREDLVAGAYVDLLAKSP